MLTRPAVKAVSMAISTMQKLQKWVLVAKSPLAATALALYYKVRAKRLAPQCCPDGSKSEVVIFSSSHASQQHFMSTTSVTVAQWRTFIDKSVKWGMKSQEEREFLESLVDSLESRTTAGQCLMSWAELSQMQRLDVMQSIIGKGTIDDLCSDSQEDDASEEGIYESSFVSFQCYL
jgi:hypothetical protein